MGVYLYQSEGATNATDLNNVAFVTYAALCASHLVCSIGPSAVPSSSWRTRFIQAGLLLRLTTPFPASWHSFPSWTRTLLARLVAAASAADVFAALDLWSAMQARPIRPSLLTAYMTASTVCSASWSRRNSTLCHSDADPAVPRLLRWWS